VADLLAWRDLDKADIGLAAHLAKADLATGLVRELTELQGSIGREYARRGGVAPALADAIFEHYLPRFAGDAVPDGALGTVVGLADRADTLVGGFAAGLEPTGSSDPYGLRRVALGLLQILLGRGLDVSLSDLLRLAVPLSPLPLDDERFVRLQEFLRQRQRVLLREEGLPHDVIDSVLASLGDRPVAAAAVARALPAALEQSEGAALVEQLKRAQRIQPKDGKRYEPDPSAISLPAERALHEALQAAAAARDVPIADLAGFVRALRPLVGPIGAFFDAVMVNDEDPRVRANRLGLLRAAVDLAGERFDVGALTSGGR
jgi:glycyl-tRNA synthetase beta subunit